MITESNQRILNDISKPYKHYKAKHITKSHILNKMHINGFLEHILLRLYSGFHSHIVLGKQTVDNDNKVLKQVGFLTHLGLINLHIVSKEKYKTNIKLTLSSFGKKVMQILMPHQKDKIRKVLQYKDKRKHILKIIYGILSPIECILIIISIIETCIFCSKEHIRPTIFNSPKSFSVLILTTLILLLFLSVMTLIVYLITSIQKDDFLDSHIITIHDILKVCQQIKGTQQTRCEEKYIVNCYKSQRNIIKKSGYEDNLVVQPNGYYILQGQGESLESQAF